MTMILAEALKVDVHIRSGSWAKLLPNADDTCCKAAKAAIEAADISAINMEVSVVLADDIFIRSLNKFWRQQDIPTNVLAFPCENTPAAEGKIRLLGDIVVADGVIQKEALEERKPIADHLAHMVVHGALHLLGYNHVSDEGAREMEGLEKVALATLDVENPYSENEI